MKRAFVIGHGRHRSAPWTATVALVAALAGSAARAEPPLPQHDGLMHLGVVTCAGSTCHGATEAFEDSPVRQDEFVTWHQKDKHAQAYKVLLNDQSKAIARNLGIEAAHAADMCLDCHADNAKSRGKRFQLSDGVGCEACHGGSEKWLGPHISGHGSHQDNLALGMYPTADPAARARLCLSCHFGNGDKFVTHRLMGAGHPRMSFEVDTFTVLQPAHFDRDRDYAERKPYSRMGASLWALGQATQARLFLEAFMEPEIHGSGLFPELVFFDCHACHHPMSDKRWAPRESVGLGPGAVRLNDSTLLMLEPIAAGIAPEAVEGLREGLRGLHRATTEGMDAARHAAAALRERVVVLESRIVEHRFVPDSLSAMARVILSRGTDGAYRDYAGAEQSAMAVAALVSSLERAGAMGAEDLARVRKAVDALFDALADEDGYRADAYRATMRALQSLLPRSG